MEISSQPPPDEARLLALVADLRSQPAEAEWLEFKRGNEDAQAIGVRISALANAARLADRDRAFMVWGIDDATHDVVGTSFQPAVAKRGNQPLQFWLAQRLSPSPHFTFTPINHPQGRVVLLEIYAESSLPVQFDGKAYIRVGSATPLLRDYPEREAALLTRLRPFAWESGIAISYVPEEQVLKLLDYDSYIQMLGIAVPSTTTALLANMKESGVITPNVGGQWDITNLGASLFGRSLLNFPSISRKALRIIHYIGGDRLNARPEQSWVQGYARGFQEFETFLKGISPGRERIETFRTSEGIFPPEAIKELLANTLIHQDMTVTGTGPMVEVFDDRIEFSNPGEAVTDIQKLFFPRPRSRNEKLAKMMREMTLCEERGMGLRKVITTADRAKLPPPFIQSGEGSTRVVLYAPRRTFDELDKEERIRACYQHAAVLRESRHKLTNASLRDRFGGEIRVDVVSRVIRDCLKAGLIKVADPEKPKSGYLPYWA